MTVQEDLLTLARLKEQQEAINAERLAVEARLIEQMEAAGQKSISVGDSVKGALVKSSVMTVDEEALKKRLSAAQWKKVTKTVLDKERLEASIVTGDVDANVVASVSTEKDRKPYIKVTIKGAVPDTKPAPKKRAVRPKKTA